MFTFELLCCQDCLLPKEEVVDLQLPDCLLSLNSAPDLKLLHYFQAFKTFIQLIRLKINCIPVIARDNN